MARQDSVLGAAFLLLLVAAPVRAQVIETPVPFDSVGRLRVVTPTHVARYGLQPPVWPVQGDFTAARLFAVSSGGTVLSVERHDGRVERHLLDDAQVTALRTMVQAALGTTPDSVDRPAAPRPSAARGAFARNQMILSAILYGPLIASFADEGKTATALYLLSTGMSFFAVNEMARNASVTTAQNALATDGSLRGYAAASGLTYAFTGEGLDRKVYSAIGLAGAIGGAKFGYEYASRLTDAEAQAARKISTLSAATTLGVLGTLGMFDSPGEDRPIVGATVAGGFAGYLMGPGYPRRARYNVTAGDVRVLHVGALIGAGIGLTPVVGIADQSELKWALATAGMLGGAALMDRGWMRRYDHGQSDVNITWLGTLAGALMGGAVLALAEPSSPEPVLGVLSAGAFLGALGGHSIADPPPAAPREATARPAAPQRRFGQTRATFTPLGLAAAAAGVRGQHAILSLRF